MMSLFVEVDSLDKKCPVIVNLDMVVEIAPLTSGGCAIFMQDGTGGMTSMKVNNNYDEFKQFVLQKVSAADIEKRFGTKTKTKELTMDIPKL
jgi:hypothetical protein